MKEILKDLNKLRYELEEKQADVQSIIGKLDKKLEDLETILFQKYGESPTGNCPACDGREIVEYDDVNPFISPCPVCSPPASIPTMVNTLKESIRLTRAKNAVNR